MAVLVAGAGSDGRRPDSAGSAIEPSVPAADAGDTVAPALPLAPPPFTCAEPVNPADRSLLSAVVELGKPRITRLVAITALGGLALAVVGRIPAGAPTPWLALALAATACALGTSLSSGGANGLNQALEADADALMHRTRRRPIPSGRLDRPAAVLASGLMLLVGAAVLWAFAGQAAAVVALLTAVAYVGLYTPLKRVTVLNTWVGTIPGALPPLIGWCAAATALGGEPAGWAALAELGGWSLVLLMLVWQIPHFLALAWLHRDDYARGGMRMLPVVDPDGRRTVTQIVLWSALFLPASLSPWLLMPERVGLLYAIVAALTGGWYLVEASRLIRDRSHARARRVFLASVIHLPVLMLALAVSSAIG